MQSKLETVNYFTVALGAGPSGLLATLSALKFCPRDSKVALIGDRIEERGIREQILWIEVDVFDFIEKMVGTDLVRSYVTSMEITEKYEKTEKKGYFITTGDLEKLLYEGLQEQYTQGVHYDVIQSEKIATGVEPKDKIKCATKVHDL
ncbi:MAG: hypothetical protein ACRCXC_09105 [Legionella sp.]